MSQTVALIAHDGKKDDMIRLAIAQRDLLEQFHLIATGTTGERVARMTNLVVERMLSGPMGGMPKSPPASPKAKSSLSSFSLIHSTLIHTNQTFKVCCASAMSIIDIIGNKLTPLVGKLSALV